MAHQDQTEQRRNETPLQSDRQAGTQAEDQRGTFEPGIGGLPNVNEGKDLSQAVGAYADPGGRPTEWPPESDYPDQVDALEVPPPVPPTDPSHPLPPGSPPPSPADPDVVDPADPTRHPNDDLGFPRNPT